MNCAETLRQSFFHLEKENYMGKTLAAWQRAITTRVTVNTGADEWCLGNEAGCKTTSLVGIPQMQ